MILPKTTRLAIRLTSVVALLTAMLCLATLPATVLYAVIAVSTAARQEAADSMLILIGAWGALGPCGAAMGAVHYQCEMALRGEE